MILEEGRKEREISNINTVYKPRRI